MFCARMFCAALILLSACAPEVLPPANTRMLVGNCPAANPNDSQPDDAALQNCLARGGTVRLNPGNPGYIIAQGIRLVHHGTVLTSAQRPLRAKLIAHANLNAPMLEAIHVNAFELSYLSIDGNKGVRTVDCVETPPLGRRYGSNVHLEAGDGYKVHRLEVLNAHCGTALGINGTNFEVHHNVIRGSGHTCGSTGSGPDPWADGITSGDCSNGHIHDNLVEDSTDIGIVVGGGQGCLVENNTIHQIKSHAFAGLAIHHFSKEGKGIHTGSVFRNNNISSAVGMCDFGISVGHHPWDAALDVSGARIVANRVSGAVINLAVDGFAGGTIRRNILSSPQGQGTFCAGNCNFMGNYTVAHTVNACLQPGWQNIVLHSHQCQPGGETIVSNCGLSLQNVGSIHTGPGICDGNVEGAARTGASIDAGWLSLAASNSGAVFAITGDDCGSAGTSCPAGTFSRGSVHSGPGVCDGNPEGRDYRPVDVDSGWLDLCAPNYDTLWIVSHDDCTNQSRNCPPGYQDGGSVHTGPAKCDGNAEGRDYQGNTVDSGWMRLCVRNQAGLVIDQDDCS